LEGKIKINKAAIALIMAAFLWMILMFDAYTIFVERSSRVFQEFLTAHPDMADLPVREQFINFISNQAIVHHLGNVTETLFFIMCVMLIVDLVDKHGAFLPIAEYIATTSKRKLLWYLCFTAFFFAPFLDNIAAAIVLLVLLHKIVIERADRLKYACMTIIAANAGGAFSPIGDVTTILLWVGGNISPVHQLTQLFLPALANMLAPLVIAHFWLFRRGEKLAVANKEELAVETFIPPIPVSARKTIFCIGILSIALVPVFQYITGLPPFLGVLTGLAILWTYTDALYAHQRSMQESRKMRVISLLPNVDLATIFFFLGILMSVGALETSGHLGLMSNFLDKHIHQPYLISFVIGLVSSCVDNVALVAATMGMYPLQAGADLPAYAQFFAANGEFWTFLAYCGVTGGSIFIIGSATGVTVMGVEKIDFMYYTKRFTLLALIGYCCGAGVYLLLR
jgi:Na+/H+ antiporter NhaD/arsenite permease-like protein